MDAGRMGLGNSPILTKAIYSLTLRLLVQQIFLERTVCARPYCITGDSAGNKIKDLTLRGITFWWKRQDLR